MVTSHEMPQLVPASEVSLGIYQASQRRVSELIDYKWHAGKEDDKLGR